MAESELVALEAVSSAGVLAVDVGGSKLAVGIVDSSGTVLIRRQTPTNGEGAEELFGSLAALIEEVIEQVPEVLENGATGPKVAGIGVGCGGPMTGPVDDRLVSPLNIPQWRKFPLSRRLAELTGLSVATDNDAKALALGEGWCGAAVGYRDYLAMVVSTGVGGGLVLDGRLLDGVSGNAGHIGHMVVSDGPACACGARGCLEAVASGPAIARRTGREPAEASVELRREIGGYVGQAVGAVVNLLDLSLITVAGSVALGFGKPFFDSAQRALDRACCLSFAKGARIVPAGLGADGPLVGAAAVWHSLDSQRNGQTVSASSTGGKQ